MNEQLTKSDWIKHGLTTLAQAGTGALKVGPMAGQLNVSRGSFYWHFSDIADFRAQLLQSWQELTTDQTILGLGQRVETDRLKKLMQRAFVGQRRLDRAVRSWALQDDDVAKVVGTVDTRRIEFIANLLVIAGVDEQRSAGRAAFIYWAYLGQESVLAPGHSSINTGILDEISELFEQ